MKPLAYQLKQMTWSVPVFLTIISPLAAQALTVQNVTHLPSVTSRLATDRTTIVSEESENIIHLTYSDSPTAKTNTGGVIDQTFSASESRIYKSSGEGLLVLLLLLGVPTVVIFIVANSNGSSSSRRSSSRRSSSSSYTGGDYSGGDYGGGGYSGGSDSGGGSFGGGDSGGGGAGGDF